MTWCNDLMTYCWLPSKQRTVKTATCLLTLTATLHVAESEGGRFPVTHRYIRTHTHTNAHVHVRARMKYVSSIRGKRDLCDLHTGHGSYA